VYKEDDYLLMSGIQHFSFCRRQWALIHIEQQWEENVLTAEGRIDHTVCHDEKRTERRGNIITFRGYRVVSHELEVVGTCDVVEFIYDEQEGIPLARYDGLWLPRPVEYKHGHAKTIDADRLQLCAQAMALEEMLQCHIPEGFLFYEETHRRERVEIDDVLRQTTRNIVKEMNDLFRRGYTPKVKTGTFCKSCSLQNLCLPKLNRKMNVRDYITSHLEDEQ